jgi:hypothetical protein
MESSYFCEYGSHAKFQIPAICPYCVLGTEVRKEEEKKKKINYQK